MLATLSNIPGSVAAVLVHDDRVALVDLSVTLGRHTQFGVAGQPTTLEVLDRRIDRSTR